MSDNLRVAYTRGVTPGKWTRIWHERHPRVPLELTLLRAVTGVEAQAAPLRAGTAQLALLRLPAEQSEGPEGLHLIPLYEERPFVVAPKESFIAAADELLVADLADEPRHPFDDEIEAAVQLVAANVGVVVVPQSIARLYARTDVIARPVTDLPGWRIGLAWPRDADDPHIEDFIGVVRGRTANSSRGATPPSPAPRAPQRPRSELPRPSRGGRTRRRPTR